MEFNWTQELFGNSIISYGIVLGIATLATILAGLIVRIAQWKLKRVRTKKNDWFSLVRRALDSTRLKLIFLFALCVTLFQVELSAGANAWVRTLAVVFITLQILYWVNGALNEWSDRYHQKSLDTMGTRDTTMRMILFFVRILIYVFAFLVVIDNIPGVDITALVASLGIGGIAIALALQNILTDIFASLTITLDRPFVIGDFIIVGDLLGVVEHIGLKTTRVRSLSGEQLVFSNSDLLTSRIRNFKRMNERRVAFTIGITYDTELEKIEKIPSKIREIIESMEDVRFDRAHFKSHSDYSLDFEIVYYVHGPDYALYMDRQQEINLRIHRYFDEIGVEFAFPTQTIHFVGEGPGSGEDMALVQRKPKEAGA